jgi:hypothetical protein
MTIQGQSTTDGRIAFQWELNSAARAFSIQIAQDSEFTAMSRTFVVPNSISSCVLDSGKGRWYYRLGTWTGREQEGTIEWSGIYGPISIQSNKPIVQIREFPIVITATTPALQSVLLHTDLYEPYYMIIHTTQKDHFKASGLKTSYVRDWGQAQVHVRNLDPQYTYSFQLHMLSGNKGVLPTNTIELLTEPYSIRNKRAAANLKPSTGTDHSVYAADRALVRSAMESQRQQRFSSYSDYLQFQAAKARTSMTQ